MTSQGPQDSVASTLTSGTVLASLHSLEPGLNSLLHTNTNFSERSLPSATPGSSISKNLWITVNQLFTGLRAANLHMHTNHQSLLDQHPTQSLLDSAVASPRYESIFQSVLTPSQVQIFHSHDRLSRTIFFQGRQPPQHTLIQKQPENLLLLWLLHRKKATRASILLQSQPPPRLLKVLKHNITSTRHKIITPTSILWK